MLSYLYLVLSNVVADGSDIFAFLIILAILRWLWTVFTGDGTYSRSSSSSSNFSGSSFNFSGDKFRSKIKQVTKKNDQKIEVDIYGKIEGNEPKMNPFITSLSLRTYLFDSKSNVPFYSINQGLTDMASESFMSEIGLGNVRYDQLLNFRKWTNVATVSKNDIVHPRKGNRSIVAKSFLVDNTIQPIIIAGQPYNNQGIIKTIQSNYKMTFDTPGYLDEIDNNEEILCSIVDLAVNVAKADKDFDKKEGQIIKKWMTDVYKDSLDENKVEIKKLLNEQFTKSYSRESSLHNSVKSFNELAGITQKFNAIDLCVNVLTADGKEDKKETQMIEKIVSDLGLDHQEYLKRKEKLLLKSDVSVSGGCTEASLGINPKWTKSKKLKFVKTEFIKWNGRLNTLKEGAQRESAQNKLNCLAEMRLEYEKK